jgi:HSP20 family molecular chaperone IbpA
MAEKYLPLTDVLEKKDDYVIASEIPGVSKSTLEVEADRDQVIIKARPSWKPGTKWRTLYREFNEDYEFERRFDVGRFVKKDSIKAKVENGVVVMILPKNEEMKPRKIEVQ